LWLVGILFYSFIVHLNSVFSNFDDPNWAAQAERLGYSFKNTGQSLAKTAEAAGRRILLASRHSSRVHWRVQDSRHRQSSGDLTIPSLRKFPGQTRQKLLRPGASAD